MVLAGFIQLTKIYVNWFQICLCFTLSIFQCFTRNDFVHAKFSHFKVQITKCITVGYIKLNYVNFSEQTGL